MDRKERMKQQIREAADFLIGLLTVPAEAQPDSHDHRRTDDAEPDGDAPDAQQDRRAR